MSDLKRNKKTQIKPEVFDELLDSLDESGFEGLRLKGPRISSQKAENFELLGLLEYEYERLYKTNNFLNAKLTRNEDFNLMTKLLIQQESIISNKKEKLVEQLCSKSSSLMNSMKEVFNKSYKLT